MSLKTVFLCPFFLFVLSRVVFAQTFRVGCDSLGDPVIVIERDSLHSPQGETILRRGYAEVRNVLQSPFGCRRGLVLRNLFSKWEGRRDSLPTATIDSIRDSYRPICFSDSNFCVFRRFRKVPPKRP